MYLWTDSMDPVYSPIGNRRKVDALKAPEKYNIVESTLASPSSSSLPKCFTQGLLLPAHRTLAVSWLLISCSSPTDRSAVRQPAASEVLLSGDHSITRFVNRPKIECSHVNRAKGQCTGSNPPSVAPNSSSLRPCGPKTPRRRFRDQPGKSNWKCEPGVGPICFYFVGFSKCRQLKRMNDNKDDQ